MVRRLTQRMLRPRSGSAQVRSPLTQVKAAVAHVCRLKQNQRKKKLILSLWVYRKEYHDTRRDEILLARYTLYYNDAFEILTTIHEKLIYTYK
jgi:hypothetical protein